MRNPVFHAMPIALATALCTSAFAYTVQGTVTNKADGKAIADASVSLLKEGKSAKTDKDGKFTIHEDEAPVTDPNQGNTDPNQGATDPNQGTDAIKGVYTPGFVNINNGILSYSQSSSAPVQVKVFDMMGNQVMNKTLQGAGQLDLRNGISAQGMYLAKVRVGSAMQSIKFTTNGHYSSTVQASNGALMKAVTPGETLTVIANGFDTLSVPLSSLDTTLTLALTASAPTYKFGYALKNDPTPSKGCGTNSTLKSVQSVENGQKYQMRIGNDNREYFITLPKNYDNKKPHKLLFALHCYGSSGEDFVHHKADYDHPTPYYGQQVLDKNDDYIFVSPNAVGGVWTKEQGDHDFFAQMLTTMEENYCIDTSRVFITGFSFGAMFSYSLMQDFQDRIRAAATYAVADYNIWLPSQQKNLPVAWMNVHGKNDGRCDYSRALTSALPRILKRNGKASDGDSQFTDASSEKPEEVQGGSGHVCYDFKTVDPRFPVKWCSWPGDHQWTAHDEGNMSVGWNWEQTWVPEEVHKFFEQF